MERSIGRMITLLARKSQSYIGCVLSKYNLTAAEQPFFMALQRYEGITQEELTALVCVDKAATARVVKSLEKKGFLTRTQDKRDKRKNLVYPTDQAKQLGNTVKNELLHFNSLLTEGIDPQDIKQVYGALLKMEENFSKILNNRGMAAENGGKKHGTSN